MKRKHPNDDDNKNCDNPTNAKRQFATTPATFTATHTPNVGTTNSTISHVRGIKRKHNNDDDNGNCDNPTNAKRHSHKCDLCKEIFANKTDLLVHNKTVHRFSRRNEKTKISMKPGLCPLCDNSSHFCSQNDILCLILPVIQFL